MKATHRAYLRNLDGTLREQPVTLTVDDELERELFVFREVEDREWRRLAIYDHDEDAFIEIAYDDIGDGTWNTPTVPYVIKPEPEPREYYRGATVGDPVIVNGDNRRATEWMIRCVYRHDDGTIDVMVDGRWYFYDGERYKRKTGEPGRLWLEAKR